MLSKHKYDQDHLCVILNNLANGSVRMYFCTAVRWAKCWYHHANMTMQCWDISVCTKVVDWPTNQPMLTASMAKKKAWSCTFRNEPQLMWSSDFLCGYRSTQLAHHYFKCLLLHHNQSSCSLPVSFHRSLSTHTRNNIQMCLQSCVSNLTISIFRVRKANFDLLDDHDMHGLILCHGLSVWSQTSLTWRRARFLF